MILVLFSVFLGVICLFIDIYISNVLYSYIPINIWAVGMSIIIYVKHTISNNPFSGFLLSMLFIAMMGLLMIDISKILSIFEIVVTC